jgi:D-alanyl-D-alanine carboxypeptidase
MVKHLKTDSSRQSLLLTILFTILSCLLWGFIMAFILQGPLRSWLNRDIQPTDVQQESILPESNVTDEPATPVPTVVNPDDFQAIVLRTIELYDYPLFLYPVSQNTRLPLDYPISDAQLPLVTIDEVQVADILEEPLNRLLTDAKKAGFSPYLRSGFRSIDDQYTAYSQYVTEATASGKNITEAQEYAKRFSAEPGYSEHHLGLAIDLLDNFYPDWIIARKNYDKGMYLWLQQHAHEYGFVISYPAGLDPTYAKPGSGYSLSEPWHLRFVGDELATWLYQARYLDPLVDVSVNDTLRDAYFFVNNHPPIQ